MPNLVLARKAGQRIVLHTRHGDVVLTFQGPARNRDKLDCRVLIDAPLSVRVLRGELLGNGHAAEARELLEAGA